VGAALPARAAAAPPETPEPPVVLALGAGMATVMLPLVLGVTHTADATSDASRVTGLAVAGVGCALAPFVSHAVLGEYARGAAFSAVPLAAEIGVVSLVTAMPDAVFHGTQLSRTTFGILFSFDVFGAALGLIDVALAPERGRKHGGLTVVPSVGRGHAGILVGGTL
jgi:hypothetical protein